MKKAKMSRALIYLVLSLSMISTYGCGGGGGGGETAATDGAGTTGGGTTGGGTSGAGSPEPPQISGFDFALQEGDFWEYGWDYYHNSWQQSGSNTTTAYDAAFRVSLGQSTLIDGLTAYPVNLSGSVRNDYKPRWKYIAMDGNKMYGSTDGLAMKVIFDAQEGYWAGGGFLTTFPDTTLILGQPGTITNSFITDSSVIRVGRSDEQSQCETIAGHTICGEDSYSYKTYEYFKQGIGSVGYFYENTYSFGGTYSSGGTYRDHVGLTSSSTRQDTVEYVLEHEPNNDILTNAMPVSHDTQVRGHSVLEGDTDYGGLVSAYMNETDEIEPNSTPASSQILSFPDLVNGDIVRETLSSGTTSVVINGTTYYVNMEDWYEFTLSDYTTIQIKLDFSQSANADIDVYLFEKNGPQLRYGAFDNLASGDYTELITYNSLPPGSYRIGIDACACTGNSTTVGTNYTLAVDNIPASNSLSIADWFQVDRIASGAVPLTIDVDGVNRIIVKNSAGGNIPTTTYILPVSGLTRYTTGYLNTGTYYIGVEHAGPYSITPHDGIPGDVIIISN